MNIYLVLILLMALILVVLVFKPELGMQLKSFSEKFAFDADWKPSKGTKWRFIIGGVFIEIIFIVILILLLLNH
jgi:NADH:ubiquinone oxidoreductase subunit 3 (subunit A)